MDTRETTHNAGLCANCRWSRQVGNRRGSMFVLCGRSAEEPSYPKYPRLPVRECSGFENRSGKSAARGRQR